MTMTWDAQPGPTPPLQDEPTSPPTAGQGSPYAGSAATSPPDPAQWAAAPDAAPGPYGAEYPYSYSYSYSAPTPPPPLPPTSSSPPTRRGGGWRAALAAGGVALLVTAGFGAGLYYKQADTPSTPAIASRGSGQTNVSSPAAGQPASNQPSTPLVTDQTEEPAAAVAVALGPAVVQIELTQGLGSGVIYDKSGLILTNAHVVAQADGNQVKVRLQDGSVLDGQVLGADSQADIAVVQVKAGKDLPAARLASDKPKVGQTAIGIGSPFGLQETVTAGIISAIERPVGSGEAGNGITINMIQTDASINPGNSGGALANRKGEVIGINTQILSETGQNNGIGFAIPIQTAKMIADKIVSGQSLEHGFIGVSTKATTDGGAGALVAGVSSGGPAAKAGLQIGDVVTAVDGTPVKDPSDLSASIVLRMPGESVTLDVKRSDGSTATVTVQLGTRPTQSATGSGSQGQSPGGNGQTPQVPGQGGSGRGGN
ncbi:MAG: trypsin-like peptidase domain-containing protein [Actinobacteria bacterium]|nr:trypsin-like peptidase domain-containing protein [Actinomycetota bacterium]